jgi:hypothetical protein
MIRWIGPAVKRNWFMIVREEEVFEMLSKIMKWVSSAVLLLMAAFSGAAEGYQLLSSLVVFLGAIIVLQEAVGEREYVWAAGFLAIALIFNPAAPVFQASGTWFPIMALVCTAVFSVSLVALKTRPVLSIASITGRTPGSESL